MSELNTENCNRFFLRVSDMKQKRSLFNSTTTNVLLHFPQKSKQIERIAPTTFLDEVNAQIDLGDQRFFQDGSFSR
jgi:hypothetical protein